MNLQPIFDLALALTLLSACGALLYVVADMLYDTFVVEPRWRATLLEQTRRWIAEDKATLAAFKRNFQLQEEVMNLLYAKLKESK